MTDGPATVTFTIHATDDASGIKLGGTTFVGATSPTGAQTYANNFVLASGTTTDGVYTGSLSMPATAEPGDWPLALYMSDQAGHTRYDPSANLQASGFPDHITVQNTHGDTSPPALVSFAASPSQVNVTDGPATVTFTIHATDDASGIKLGGTTFVGATSPTGAQTYANNFVLASGTTTDGVYTGSLSMPATAEPGDWPLALYMSDQAGHTRYDPSANLQASGFPDHITVQNTHGDTSPPALVSFAASPSQVNVTDGPATVTFTIHATDDASGIKLGGTTFVGATSPTGAQTYANNFVLASGTTTDGVYTGSLSMPATAEPGDWPLALYMSDQAGHTRYDPSANLQASGFLNHITVQNTHGDTAPSAPSGVAATRGDTSATVSWTPPPATNGSPITSYTVTSTPGGITKTVTASQTTATVTGLTNGTGYRFKVTATNTIGTSPPSAASQPHRPAAKPAAPTAATATKGDAQATVSWVAPAPNGGPRSPATPSPPPPAASPRPSRRSQTTATVTGLTNGTGYRFKVTATNTIGTSPPSAARNLIIPAAKPAAPTAATATKGDAQATVSWVAPAPQRRTPVTSYTVTSTPGGITKTVTAQPDHRDRHRSDQRHRVPVQGHRHQHHRHQPAQRS